MSWNAFFDMSGYGAYVWTCYGLTLAVLIGNAWAARRRWYAALSRARRQAQSAAERS